MTDEERDARLDELAHEHKTIMDTVQAAVVRERELVTEAFMIAARVKWPVVLDITEWNCCDFRLLEWARERGMPERGYHLDETHDIMLSDRSVMRVKVACFTNDIDAVHFKLTFHQ